MGITPIISDEETKVYSGCRACHLNCPVWVTVKNGRAIKVEGDPELGPPNFGRICERAYASIQLEYSPTRVRYPLKRVGKRGEGKWQRISWEQAVEEIAAKTHAMVEKYGPETFVLPGRTGRQDMGWIAHKIARTIGTPNNYYGAIQVCYLPQFHEQVTFGSYTMSGGGVAPTGLYVNFSTEHAYSWPIFIQHILDNQEKGMKIISVDPVGGPISTKADEWVAIRPGTDLAFVMACIKIIMEENLDDKAFVKQWSNAPFLVRTDTGNLLLESDIKKGGSDKRYMFWDEVDNCLKYWDTEEVQWQGGSSGKEHYDMLVEMGKKGKASFEESPASVMPENVNPALYGSYKATLAVDGHEIDCMPAYQKLFNNVAEWTPEKTSEVTGVPADQILRVARMMGTIKPMDLAQGLQYMSTNLSQYVNATQILKIITGNIENEGGSMLSQFHPATPQCFPSEYDISYADGLPLEMKRKRLGFYEHRIGCGYAWEEMQKWHPMRASNTDGMLVFPDLGSVMNAAETGKPYPVHGIFAIASNWLMHDPTTARWMRLLEDESKIELHVATDYVMTPTCEMADYVLPAVWWMERNYLSFGLLAEGPVKGMFGQAVKPVCEAKHDYDFGAMLAKELGKYDKRYVEGRLNTEWSNFYAGEYGEFWPADTIDEFRDQLSRRFFKMSFEEAVEQRIVTVPDMDFAAETGRHLIAGKFPTDTGKCNLFSTMHQMCGYPPLPVYTEPAESPLSRPDLAKEYPLVMSAGKRQPGFFHSEFRQLPMIRENMRTPDVFINPKTAAEFGVTENDWVWVEAPPTSGRAPHNRIMGKVSFRLMVAPGIVAYSQHAWWRPEKAANDDMHGALEWNAECLIEVENRSPETGTGGYRSQLCKVYKASAEDMAKYQPEITLEQLKALMPVKEVCD